MNLHNEIMNIRCQPDKEIPAVYQASYKLGHRDARHAAAELALAAETENEALLSQVSVLRAERDNAWAELRDIRVTVNANSEESTLDEISRVVARLAEFSEKGKAVVIQRDKAKELNKDYSNIIHDLTVVMQAAWIEWQHGRGAEYAMNWIHNTLAGPGHIPNEDDPYGKESQAWYDANQSNPFPKCFCGRPSNILSKGQGFCSEAHQHEHKAKYVQVSP